MTAPRIASLAAPRLATEPQPDGTEVIDMARTCGPFWWAAFHGIAKGIRDYGCSSCGTEAVRLVEGMHDVVNAHLGKPIHTPESLAHLSEAAHQSVHTAGLQCQVCSGQNGARLSAATLRQAIADRTGSRCRSEETGRWVPSELCPDSGDDAPPGATAATFAIGANGLTRYSLQHEIVCLDDLVTSNDPFSLEPVGEFPTKLQGRIRTRAASQAQIGAIAAGLEPAAMLTDFRSLDRGSPIVTEASEPLNPSGRRLVLSGNGRTMALKIAVRDVPDRFESYVDALERFAPAMGLATEGIERPVLVRSVLGADLKAQDTSLEDFAADANAAAVLTPSIIERAKADSQLLSAALLDALDVGDDEALSDALRAVRNKEFVGRFLEKLPAQDRGELVDAEGNLNQDGVRRITAAAFVRAMPGDAGLAIAETAFEAADPEIRNVINGYGKALAPMTRAEQLVQDGDRDADLSIGADLAATARVFAQVKRTAGMDIPKYLAQGQMLERELSAFQEQVLTFLEAHKRSARRIAEGVRAYAQAVIDQPPPQQGALIPDVRPAKEDLWRQATQPVMAQAVDWCNTATALRERLLNWRSFRDSLLEAQGIVGEDAIEVCTMGLTGEEVQVSIQADGSADRIRQVFRSRIGSRAEEVAEFGTGRVVYQLVPPPMDLTPEDLLGGRPQEVVRPAPRRKPEGVQPTLFIERGGEPQAEAAQGVIARLVDGVITGAGFAIGAGVVSRVGSRLHIGRGAVETEAESGQRKIPFWEPSWTTVEGVPVLRIRDSAFVAVPVTGRRNAALFDVLKLEPREWLAQLTSSEARGWLIGRASEEGIKPTGFVDAPERRSSLGQEDHLGTQPIHLDVSKSGEFVHERLRQPDDFHPGSIRTVTQGDHRLRLGCPLEAEWDAGAERCSAPKPQSRLHPRTEESMLLDEARRRGVPVVTDASASDDSDDDSDLPLPDMDAIERLIDDALAPGKVEA